MAQFWALKRFQHELFLDPDSALSELNMLIAGPWHEEALKAVSTEVSRERVVRRLSAGTRDVLRIAVDEHSRLLAIQELLPWRWPVVGWALLGAGAGIALLLFGVWHVAPLSDRLLIARSQYAVTVPFDYRLIARQAEVPLPAPRLSRQPEKEERGATTAPTPKASEATTEARSGTTVRIRITDIHPDDSYYRDRKQIIGEVGTIERKSYVNGSYSREGERGEGGWSGGDVTFPGITRTRYFYGFKFELIAD